uniref:Tail specific protease domain-containing protein n=1 Tax=Chromera velia CCMP2878 TaxID=1169474 RepID=A0A0G4H655_9ALVE|eukprot:Cvel_24847.t1-p1 / transcript=Cvel_24847.t1 / gene=Cvel_24847 / organism=Chromera_velia_CCMP2878 / gene_product=hypothetical protein / transcript_product=hypothetical protein / location=Cvel_scaffold2742:1944-3728(+) / protein_length=520 / sequence_SO=supercontig / SO=protein_coding / is_pseudo=false
MKKILIPPPKATAAAGFRSRFLHRQEEKGDGDGEECEGKVGNTTHIFGRSDELMGRTRCFPEKHFCVFSLRSFILDPGQFDRLLSVWDALASEAEQSGITNLILDVNENVGGNVALAYALLAKLFPSAPADKICPFLRIRLGPLSRLLSRHHLLGSEGREARSLALEDEQALQRTVKEWKKRDCKRGLGTHDSFKAALKGLLYFLDEVYDPETDDLHEADVKLVLETLKKEEIVERFHEAADKCREGTLDTNTLRRVATVVNDLLSVWTPFEHRGIDFVGSQWKVWGGGKRLYTLPLESWKLTCARKFEKKGDGQTQVHSFKKILIFSSGFGCVSSCDTFTSSVREWSRANPSAEPAVRFITWGGVPGDGGASRENGGSVLTGTTAPGGFVKAQNMQSRQTLWIWFALFRLFAETTGSPLLRELDKVRDLLPPLPFAMEQTPKLTRAAAFQETWGHEALPAEYYQVLTDFVLKEWYLHLNTGCRWSLPRWLHCTIVSFPFLRRARGEGGTPLPLWHKGPA